MAHGITTVREPSGRGIDFSLSMVIFLLTMSQVLILTSNFIISNRSYQDSIEGTTFADSLARDIVLTNGQNASGNDWIGTDSTTKNNPTIKISLFIIISSSLIFDFI